MARKKTRTKRGSVVSRLRAQIRKMRMRKTTKRKKTMGFGSNRGGGRSFGRSFRKQSYSRPRYNGGGRRTGLRVLGVRLSFPKMLLWVGAGVLILVFGKSKIMPFIENLKSKI